MYTTNERNSEVQVEEAEAVFKAAGIETITKGISLPMMCKIQLEV